MTEIINNCNFGASKQFYIMSRPYLSPFGKLALALMAIALAFSSCNNDNQKTTNEDNRSKKSSQDSEESKLLEENVERFKDAAMELDNSYHTLSDEFNYWPECGIRVMGSHLASLISLKELEKMLPYPLYVSGPHRKGQWDLENDYDFGHYNPEAIEYLADLAKEVVADKKFVKESKPLVNEYLYDKMLIMMVLHDALYDKSLPELMESDKNTLQLRKEIFKDIIEYKGGCGSYACDFQSSIFIDVDSWNQNSSTEHFLYFWARRWEDGTIDLFYEALSTVFKAYYPEYQYRVEDYYWHDEWYDDWYDEDYYETYPDEEDEMLEITKLGQETDEIFTIVEEMPEYPGGVAKLQEYLVENIKYPKTALEEGIQGRVFISFVVEKDGSVSNATVLRALGGGCDEEALRVVKGMPKWEPGKQSGKTVRVSYILPISFQLQ